MMWLFSTICSLLVYRKIIDFYLLVLYSATYQKCLSDVRVFWWSPQGLRHRIISSAKRNTLISSFPVSVCINFFSLSYLIALAKNSSPILNKSGQSRHPCLISFRAFNFSCWVCCWLWVCHTQSLLCWGTFLVFLVSSECSLRMDIEFFQNHFLYLLIWSCDFVFLFICCFNEINLSRYRIFFTWCWFCLQVLSSFSSVFIKIIGLYFFLCLCPYLFFVSA
jgi:hypothetical protein